MPVAINSPARNFFLLASSGQQEITSFIRRISTPGLSETYGYEPSRIEFVETDQRYLLGGSQLDSTDSSYEGFLTKANEAGTKTFDIKLQSTDITFGVTIRSIAQDSNENIIVCGRKGPSIPYVVGAPYVGKFDFDGNNIWYASTTEVTENERIEYTDISIDSNDDIYLIGYDPTYYANNTIISKYTSDGNVVWSKKISDTGSDGFSDFKFRNISINTRDELIVTGSIEGITKTKGVVAKYDVSGNQIWIKTFEDKELATNSSYRSVIITASYVDSNDYIYCCGYSEDLVVNEYYAVVFRLDPAGNIVWQKKTNYINDIRYTSISADDLTGQTLVVGEVWTGSEGFTIAQRFNSAGELSWTRKISSSNARSAYVNTTSDPSYYYLIFADETQQASDPESFLYGKLSITGNGLGAFTYNDGVLDQSYLVTTIPVKTGTIFDGSIRNDTSDFVTYPYSATKVLFDDLTMIYQPKLPVHDGSDHNIIGENVLSEPEQIVLATDTTVIDTSSFRYVSVQPNGTGSGTLGGFAIGDHIRFGLTTSGQPTNTSWTGSNNITTTSARVFDTYALDLRRKQNVTLSLIRGNSSNGGETPDAGEDFRMWYSIDGKQTWIEKTQIIVAANNTNFNSLNTVTFDLPINSRTNSTHLRFGQRQSSGYNFDHWGLTQIVFDTVFVSDPEAPKISSDAIVYDASLLLNYDFSNLATYSGTGTTVKNLSSSFYTGELKGVVAVPGGVQYPTFNPDGYFDFDPADNQYIDTGLNVGSVTELTVEAWLRVDTYTNDGAGIAIGDNATGTSQCYLGRGNSGGDSIDWRFYTGTFLDETEFFTSDTGWKHYVGTYDQTGGAGSNQGRMILYVDGVQQDVALSNNTSAINFAGGINIRIGTNTDSSASTSFFDGKFGEVRIYNRALDATEVSQNFNATRAKYGV